MTSKPAREAFEANYDAKYFQSDFTSFNGTFYESYPVHEAMNTDWIAFQKGWESSRAKSDAVIDGLVEGLEYALKFLPDGCDTAEDDALKAIRIAEEYRGKR